MEEQGREGAVKGHEVGLWSVTPAPRPTPDADTLSRPRPPLCPPFSQSDFFNRAADIVSRRQAMLNLLAIGGGAAITAFGIKGSKDAKLPITVGPQTTGENGKGGSVRSRL